MALAAAKHPTQCADRCWVVVDTAITVDRDDQYSVNCHPIQWMPDTVEYFIGEQLVRTESPKRFFRRKRDAQAAIDSLPRDPKDA